MIDFTAAEIAEIVDRVVQDQRLPIGVVGSPRMTLMFEGNDGQWVTTQPLTDLEHYYVNVALYGEDRALAMRDAVNASRAAGNDEHDLSGM